MQGILSKDERTNRRMSDTFDATDTDGSVSNISSLVSGSSGQSGPDHDIMVMYDVPFWMEDHHLVKAFKSKNKTLLSVSRLHWTMGDISLAAWKLIGPSMSELSGSVIRDPHRKKPVYMVTMNHYVEERASHNRQQQGGRHIYAGSQGIHS